VPQGPEPNWTAELIGKSFRQRVLRVRLTQEQHRVTYSVNVRSATLQVDDVEVVRRYSTTGTKDEPAVEIPFELSDGDAVRHCTFMAYYGAVWIERAVLTVDGRLLYDEGRPEASLT
jgi:hypothetical protein